MDDNIKKELQSAAFDRLVKHLRERKDVQNLDLMNLAGFCRNCLSKWYREEAEKKGIKISEVILFSDKISSVNIYFSLVFSFYNYKTYS